MFGLSRTVWATWLASLLTVQFYSELAPPGRLTPRKAHVLVSLSYYDGGTYPRAPHVGFYATPALSGQPILQLNEHGLVLRDRLVCAWPKGHFALDAGELKQMVLTSTDPDATGSGHECPAEFPIRSFSHDPQALLFIELTRVDGSLGEVSYRGAPYYFSLKAKDSTPANPRYTIEPPAVSPPVLGVVDIPRFFRPPPARERRAILLRRLPRMDSPTVATLSSAEHLVVYNLGNATLTAGVYARTNRWSLLQLVDGRTGWLAPEDAGKFASLERVLSQHTETFMTEAWDGTVQTEPDSGVRVRVPPDPRRTWVGYVERQGTSNVPIFSEPNMTARVLRHVDDERLERIAIPTPPPGGSVDRVIVFSRRPGWFEVRVDEPYSHEHGTRAWIAERPSEWTFHEAPSAIESERLLSVSWGPAELSGIAIKEMKHVHGELWLRVDVLQGGGCEVVFSDPPLVVLATGWIPAQDASGRLTVWFETYCD